MVDEDSVPPNAIALNAQAVYTIKFDSEWSTSLVIQGHSDPEKDRVVNDGPAALMSAVRLLVILGISLGSKMWFKDVKQSLV